MRVLLLELRVPAVRRRRRRGHRGARPHVGRARCHRGRRHRRRPVGVRDGAAVGREPPREGLLNVHRVRCRRTSVHQAGMRDAASYLRRRAAGDAAPVCGPREYDAAHFFFSLPTGAMIPFLDLGKTPVIVSLRGSDVPGYDSAQSRTWNGLTGCCVPLTRWIWRRADRVVPVCESLGRHGAADLPGLEYTVIPNGVDLERFHPAARGAASAPGPRPLSGRGAPGGAEGHRRSDPRHRVAGAGAVRARNRGQRAGRAGAARARRPTSGSTALVKFSGSLDRADRRAPLSRGRPLHAASVEEAFGNVFAEALASGLPIVGSNVGGIPGAGGARPQRSAGAAARSARSRRRSAPG